MRKTKLISIIILMSISLTGCAAENLPTNTTENTKIEENLFIETNEPEIIDERYKTVDKKDSTYAITNKWGYYYEAKDGFYGIPMESEVPRVDDKEYGYILSSYTYPAEVCPTNMDYNTAMKLVNSVLPDDIKEERVKYFAETNRYYIVYSSSIGNLVVGLNLEGYSEEGKVPDLKSSTIVGISYKREISE